MRRITVHTVTLAALTAIALLGTGCSDSRPVVQIAGADPARGKMMVRQYGCVACHTIPGIATPSGKVGPPLAGLAHRAYIGGVLPNTPDALVRWLLDPPAVDPRTAMPNVGLSTEEARDIAAFLYTLD